MARPLFRNYSIAGKFTWLMLSTHTPKAQGAVIAGGLTDFSPLASPVTFCLITISGTLCTLASTLAPAGYTKSQRGANLYYGSGFTDGSSDLPGAHLEPHMTADFSLGRTFAKRLTASVTALNLTNRRFLLDNSLTFGGTHYADPRQIYLQLTYRFHY